MKKDLTIYDVQVNCARLSKEKIENLARIVKENGGKILDDEVALKKHDVHIYFRIDNEGLDFGVWRKSKYKQSISYARFVEMSDKKELEVGKWYKDSTKIQFVFRQNDDNNFGVIDSNWNDKGLYCSNHNLWTLATEQEISTILIAEAKKRFGEDWENAKIKACVGGVDGLLNNGRFDVFYDIIRDRLWNKNGIIYEKGKWAELLREESFNTTPKEKEAIIKSVEAIDQMGREVEKTMNILSKPSHYKTKSGYDVIDLWHDNKLNANQGAMCKYILRAGKKLYPNMNERESYYEDMKKAFDHMSREIEFIKKELGK